MKKSVSERKRNWTVFMKEKIFVKCLDVVMKTILKHKVTKQKGKIIELSPKF